MTPMSEEQKATPVELAPCPLCGEPAHMNGGGKAPVVIGCDTEGCYLAAAATFYSRSAAIDAWNGRNLRASSSGTVGGPSEKEEAIAWFEGVARNGLGIAVNAALAEKLARWLRDSPASSTGVTPSLPSDDQIMEAIGDAYTAWQRTGLKKAGADILRAAFQAFRPSLPSEKARTRSWRELVKAAASAEAQRGFGDKRTPLEFIADYIADNALDGLVPHPVQEG